MLPGPNPKAGFESETDTGRSQPVDQIQLMSVFVNKVLLEHPAMSVLYRPCLFFFFVLMAEWSSWDTDHEACKAENIYCLAL